MVDVLINEITTREPPSERTRNVAVKDTRHQSRPPGETRGNYVQEAVILQADLLIHLLSNSISI